MTVLPAIWWLAPISSAVGLVLAFAFYKNLLTKSEGTPRMIEIAGYVKEGAMAYLKRQNTVIFRVFVVVAIILAVMAYMGIQSPFAPLVFLTGGFFSALAGYLGMKTATNASARTAAACRDSLDGGLKVSFRAGAIMGLMVVGFGLLAISLWFYILNYAYDVNLFGLSNDIAINMGLESWFPDIVATEIFRQLKMIELTTVLLTYAMGASVMALFARVGGGIFTKAADVGADLVGKVEAGIPEDDPRNPATIADNVGDNVGDVAGMGADLYESYCGSILAASSLGASLAVGGAFNLNMVLAPMIVAGGGIVCSIIGIFMVKTKEGANQESLLKSLLIGTGMASVFMTAFIAYLSYIGFITWGTFGAVVVGLIAGIIIGQATEYYTASNFKPTQRIAEQSLQGPATNILYGISTGMISTGIPVIVIVSAIMASYGFTGGFTDVSQGIYGIAFAAIGMLSTLGIQLATDAFGPIADNAGGNAEMAGLPSEVRQRTDTLDALGNTTAATGKGFAIGSAALTALALIAAYLDTIKQWIDKIAQNDIFYIGSHGFSGDSQLAAAANVWDANTLTIQQLVDIFQINIINPKFLAGIFIGAMATFVFCALTNLAVGKAAGEMVEEVRRQFREIKGILEGTGTPDYARCVSISTKSAQKAMLLPSILAIVTPLVVGLLFHVAGVVGLLTGALTTGFSLAITLNNSGGAWDNAKKYIESGKHGGKGTLAHKAAVIGDTVGDPFKDTSGPSLNILIKLMTIVSLVFTGVILKYGIAF